MDTTRQAKVSLDADTLHIGGDWVLVGLAPVEARLAGLCWPDRAIRFELSGVTALDTAGAWLLQRTAAQLEAAGRQVTWEGLAERFQPLMASVRRLGGTPLERPRGRRMSWLEELGRRVTEQSHQYLGLLLFLGEMATVTARLMLRPTRFRWRIFFYNVAESGYRAIPIVGLLSFLLGVVIAYQGGVQLRQYGADVFIADLVGLSMLRELSPLIAAIIVAGRTGSAYAAQIGTMKVTEEINALCSIGMRPMEILVIPKVFALVVSLTLLTVFADIMGVLGGLVITNALLGIGPVTFMDRVSEAVTIHSYLIGIGKAPVFAVIIAWIGCYQGFQVSAGAEMVGRKTTTSVVQSIFLVIVVDALFSVIFSELGI